MASALAKITSRQPASFGYGPHATRLLAELQGAIHARLWAVVIILSASLIDIIRHEEQIFDLSDDDDNYLGDGLDYLSAAERKKLDWLRHTRNHLVHYEGPIEGMMGRDNDDAQLAQMADRAVAALIIMIEAD